MIKIRTGITHEFISFLFKISISTISRIFNKLTEIIYVKIKKVNIWPSKSQVREYMPSQFLQCFPDCRVIIDCTEFPVEKTIQSL